MSFTPNGIQESFPRPWGCCGNTWTQASIAGSSSLILSKQVCNARRRASGDALSHWVSVRGLGNSAAKLVAAAATEAAKNVLLSMLVLPTM
jgi:hypothetical protein